MLSKGGSRKRILSPPRRHSGIVRRMTRRTAPPVFFLVVASLAFGFVPRAAAYASILDALRDRTLGVNVLPLELGAIPKGAQRVSFLSLNLGASCDGDITVREIHVRMGGLGDVSTIRGVYLLRGYQRLSRAAKVSSSDHRVTLRPQQPIVIPACETWRVDVAADFTGDVATGSEYRFEIPGPEDLLTDATSVTGRFPVRNPQKSSITPLPAGTITVTFLPLAGTIQTVVEEILAQFQVSADSAAYQQLSAITLTNAGSARDEDVRGIYVTTNRGRALTNTAARMEGDHVTLKFFDPFFIRKGETVTFEVRGRTYAGTKTLNFVLKEPSDLHAASLRKAGRTIR